MNLYQRESGEFVVDYFNDPYIITQNILTKQIENKHKISQDLYDFATVWVWHDLLNFIYDDRNVEKIYEYVKIRRVKNNLQIHFPSDHTKSTIWWYSSLIVEHLLNSNPQYSNNYQFIVYDHLDFGYTLFEPYLPS